MPVCGSNVQLKAQKREKYNVLNQILQSLGGLLKVDGAMYWAFIFPKKLTILDLKILNFKRLKMSEITWVTIVNVGSMSS